MLYLHCETKQTIMKALIEFTVHHDFMQYLNVEDDWYVDYAPAFDVLSEMISEAVKKKELTFLYGRKRVQSLPVDFNDTGNILEDRTGIIWEGVGIAWEIEMDEDNIDSSKFRVGKCPDWLTPERVVW